MKFYIGIVGSRRRNTEADRRIVYDLVRTSIKEGQELVVVSGACKKGADNFAKQAVDFFRKEIGEEYVKLVEFPVRTWDGQTRGEYREQAHYRNRLIAENSEIGYALVHDDREGGTENTVLHYREMKKPVYLVDGEGRLYLGLMGSDANKDTDKARAEQA